MKTFRVKGLLQPWAASGLSYPGHVLVNFDDEDMFKVSQNHGLVQVTSCHEIYCTSLFVLFAVALNSFVFHVFSYLYICLLLLLHAVTMIDIINQFFFFFFFFASFFLSVMFYVIFPPSTPFLLTQILTTSPARAQELTGVLCPLAAVNFAQRIAALTALERGADGVLPGGPAETRHRTTDPGRGPC